MPDKQWTIRRHFNRWRRWPWMVLAGVGVAAFAWHLLAPGVATFLGADLATRDEYSSVYSLPVGVASLLVSAIGSISQERRSRRAAQEASGGPVIPAHAGMTSLAVPDVMSAARVRGRGPLITELTDLYRLRGRRAVRVRVLHGMGGSGKTTVALQVAHRLQKRGVTVWWISAAEDTDLQTGMRQLARRLGATASELDRDWADNAPEVLWRRLATHPGRWLLIIDNADDPRLLAPAHETVAARRGWVRPVDTFRGALLVTSRDGDAAGWGDWCRLHPVGMLSPAEGAQVLLDCTDRRAGTEDQAAALAARLGGLPLALGLAGRYLADANRLPLPGAITTFTNYQVALDTEGLAAVFPDPDESPAAAEARRIIARTWELSLTLLAQHSLAPARALLRLLSVLADAPIAYHLILDPAALRASPLFAGTDAARLRDLLHALSALGLLDLNTTDAEPNSAAAHASATLRLHPLIRDASLHHLHTAGQTPPALVLAARLLDLATTHVGAHDDPTTWPIWQLLAPHPLHLLATAAASASPEPEAINHAAAAALRITKYLNVTGLYAIALAQVSMIRDISIQIIGLEHPTALEARDVAADCTGRAGNMVAARDQYLSLLPVFERVLGDDHPKTLKARHNMALWIGEAGDAAGARDHYATLLTTRVRVLGAEHPDTLITEQALASWTGEAGDPVGARDRYLSLLPVFERILGHGHPETLKARHNMALWIGLAGDAAQARDEYAALLPVNARVLGPEHPGALFNRHNLANWTGHAGDPTAARDQLSALLPDRLRILGEEHPHTLMTRYSLAEWTGRAGNATAAYHQLSALLPVMERVMGRQCPEVGSAWQLLASLNSQQEKKPKRSPAIDP
ncbi:tetratricopeptide repeat protein [Micromonospora purpureochromogenes]|uniref:tetratricopeptide repeat protein n=1 Tax=Micromonospora purpureochromogenes TaxID=47872 RepID=UPI0033CE006B